MIYDSACVGLKYFPGKPVALGEDVVDLMGRLPAVAGRLAGPERGFELGGFCRFPPCPPAGHAPGLAGKVLKGQLESFKPAGEGHGIDEAIRRHSGFGCGRTPP